MLHGTCLWVTKFARLVVIFCIANVYWSTRPTHSSDNCFCPSVCPSIRPSPLFKTKTNFKRKQCSVRVDHRWLVNLFVSYFLVAPTSIEMVGYVAGQRIDVDENEEIELTCKVENAKPKANIAWYKGDSLMTDLSKYVIYIYVIY